MKFATSGMMLLSLALVGGCATDYCAATTTLTMRPDTPAWLVAHDRALLEDIVVHNETRAAAGCTR